MNDIIVGVAIVVLSIAALLIWAGAEGLLRRQQRRDRDREAVARAVGVLRPRNPFALSPETDARRQELRRQAWGDHR